MSIAQEEMVPDDVSSLWVPLAASAPPETPCLFCLPHAGGGASAFRSWVGGLPGVTVLPVQPPGRETRLREPSHQRMAPLVAELASVLPSVAGDRRYAVYGHSLGALVAFETAREIRRRGGTLPVHLFLSGCAAPQFQGGDNDSIATAPLRTLVAKIRQLGGTPEWLLSDPGVLDMIVPAIRADFSVKETYCYQPEPPLDIPITVLASTADSRAPYGMQAGWREHTTAEFGLNLLPGGHFAVFEQAVTTRSCLARVLADSAA